jgi:acyl-CoA thioester hydrolase
MEKGTDAFSSVTKITVRYADTDRMGIAHHSNYPVWFEAGRTDFIKRLGYSYSRIEREGAYLPLTDLSCSFKKPAGYEDEIEVHTRLSRLTLVRAVFSYEVYGPSGDLLCTGETRHAWTDTGLKPMNIAKKLPAVYETLLKCLSGKKDG